MLNPLSRRLNLSTKSNSVPGALLLPQDDTDLKKASSEDVISELKPIRFKIRDMKHLLTAGVFLRYEGPSPRATSLHLGICAQRSGFAKHVFSRVGMVFVAVESSCRRDHGPPASN